MPTLQYDSCCLTLTFHPSRAYQAFLTAFILSLESSAISTPPQATHQRSYATWCFAFASGQSDSTPIYTHTHTQIAANLGAAPRPSPIVTMSSPIYASSPLSAQSDARLRSSSFGGPRLDLVLRPSYALGPFKLGHSLWHVLNYLRSQQSLFPQINITYDETSPRLSPVVVVIQPNLHLIFNGSTQRLVMITLENLDQPANSSSNASSSSASASPSEPSHRPVNLIYNGKLIYSKGSTRSAPVALNRSTLHQILGPTYPGHPESSPFAADSLVATAYGSKGDTSIKDRNEFVLSYPDLPFALHSSKVHPRTLMSTSSSRYPPFTYLPAMIQTAHKMYWYRHPCRLSLLTLIAQLGGHTNAHSPLQLQ